MQNFLPYKIEEANVRQLSNLGYAYVGDAVYELMVRSYVLSKGNLTAGHLHKEAVAYVSAPAQAAAALRLSPHLSEEEAAVYRRGRNAQVHGVPANATIEEYHRATGLEALFGYLYLQGSIDRLNELFGFIMEDERNAT